MVFRLFYKLSFLGRFTADVVLAVFLVLLLFPILPATGMINHPSGSTTFNPEYFIALISEPILSDIFYALTISIGLALLLTTLAVIIAYFSFYSFTGKFTLLGLVSFFLIIPDSISFLLGAPIIAIFGKKNLYLLTYTSSFSWGLAAALLGAYSFFHGIRKSEIQTLQMLGGSHQQILTNYLFPKARSYLIYGSLGLGFLFSLQGLYTYQQVTGRKSLLTYHLIRPQEYFNDPGLGGAVYLILFCFAILGTIFITRYSSIEFKLAKALDNTDYFKKVRRRKPKKKSKKQKKKKIEKSILEETQESTTHKELEEIEKPSERIENESKKDSSKESQTEASE